AGSFGIATYAPCLVELAPAIFTRIGSVTKPRNRAAASGCGDLFRPQYDVAGAQFQAQSLHDRPAQRSFEAIFQVFGDLQTPRLESTRQRRLQLAAYPGACQLIA